MEEKYTKHAIFQTQFENDNQKLLYEVDLLKDMLEEHEELIIELRRQFKEKSRVLEPGPSICFFAKSGLAKSCFSSLGARLPETFVQGPADRLYASQRDPQAT